MCRSAGPAQTPWISVGTDAVYGWGTEVLRKVSEESLAIQVCVITGCAAPDIGQLAAQDVRAAAKSA